jgi:hypothetical protein
MAKRDFLVDIDLNKGQLLNTKLQNLATPPTLTINDKGFVYWNTIDEVAYFWTGIAWITWTPGTVTNAMLANMAVNTIKGRITAGTGNPEDLTATQVRSIINVADGAQVNVATNLDKTQSATQLIISSSTGTSVTIPAADSINAGVMSKVQYDQLQGAVLETDYTAANVVLASNGIGTPQPITLTADTVLGKIGAGNVSAVAIDSDLTSVSASHDTIPSAKATKDYIDSVVTGALTYQGGYDASTNTPDLDTLPSGTIKKGWTYTVTAAGTFFTEVVSIGDMLISEKDVPTLLADWTIVNKNIPDSITSKYATNITGTGVQMAFIISHNLATVDIVSYVKEATTLAKVEVEEIVTDANTLTLNFNVAPANGKVYRVTIIG